MDTVYLVYVDLEELFHEYDETVLVGVASTEDRAEEILELAVQDFHTTHVVSNAWILPVQVDEALDHSDVVAFWSTLEPAEEA